MALDERMREAARATVETHGKDALEALGRVAAVLGPPGARLALEPAGELGGAIEAAVARAEAARATFGDVLARRRQAAEALGVLRLFLGALLEAAADALVAEAVDALGRKEK